MLDRNSSPTGIEGRVATTEIMPDGIRVTLPHPRIARLPSDYVQGKIRIKFAEH